MDDGLRFCDHAAAGGHHQLARIVSCCGRTTTAQQKGSCRMPEVRSGQVIIANDPAPPLWISGRAVRLIQDEKKAPDMGSRGSSLRCGLRQFF